MNSSDSGWLQSEARRRARAPPLFVLFHNRNSAWVLNRAKDLRLDRGIASALSHSAREQNAN